MEFKRRIRFEVSEIRECILALDHTNPALFKQMVEERLRNIEKQIDKLSYEGGELNER